MADLEEKYIRKYEARDNITAYVIEAAEEKDDAHSDKVTKTVNVIGEGKLVNIAASNGHPAEIMDMSFAVQFLSALYVKDNAGKLPNKVIDVSSEIDSVVALKRLDAWGIEIDELTEEQKAYLNSWNLE